jgi:hypothetical protein
VEYEGWPLAVHVVINPDTIVICLGHLFFCLNLPHLPDGPFGIRAMKPEDPSIFCVPRRKTESDPPDVEIEYMEESVTDARRLLVRVLIEEGIAHAMLALLVLFHHLYLNATDSLPRITIVLVVADFTRVDIQIQCLPVIHTSLP